MTTLVATKSEPVVLISPVRDEVDRLPNLARCLISQTQRPDCWVIVNDGSQDGTRDLADQLESEHDWIQVVHLGDRGYRRVGGGVVEAFKAGLDVVDMSYGFVGKVDADLTFDATYLEFLLKRFEEDTSLGSASGKVFRPQGDGFVEEFMVDDMVAGQFKLYRRSCFDAIGGLVSNVLWDGIDFHRARQKGFKTRSFDDPGLRLIHHRQMGSSDRSVYRGRVRLGRGQWFMGSHPLYHMASSIFRMKEKPYVVGGVLMLWGYLKAFVTCEPRYDDLEFRRELRRWQMGRLSRLVRKGRVR